MQQVRRHGTEVDLWLSASLWGDPTADVSGRLLCGLVWRWLTERQGTGPTVNDIACLLGLTERQLRTLWQSRRLIMEEESLR